MKLTILQRSTGRPLAQLDLPDQATVQDLQTAFHQKNQRFYPSRQQFTFLPPKDESPGKQAADSKGVRITSSNSKDALKQLGLHSGDQLLFKDLGPQISWRTVFLVEYAGPLIIHPLLYFLPQYFYPGADDGSASHAWIQKVTFRLVMLHFLKRELETLFVHRFSHATMPLTNLFKNSAHYWLLSGLLLGYEVYAPSYTQAYKKQPVTNWHYALICLYLFAQVSNGITHLILRSLRPAGTTVRKVPHGYGFDWPIQLSCPNYFFESLVWLSIVLLAQSWGGLVFLIAAVGQMFVWALKKHKQYRKEFGSAYPRNRKAMFPFVA